eukprot:CAMPEP_0196743008 /NCGR_PEP_ID=MMETSP1091-20130531/50205_1 /TAXON_ID=302021 /ORGANISM="Rhodomonas sp., Strain CCMP768" /LENGTH=36 /DNA_ID= /DNA_START= /DNA_END= /DNA_ORIENTATION=
MSSSLPASASAAGQFTMNLAAKSSRTGPIEFPGSAT